MSAEPWLTILMVYVALSPIWMGSGLSTSSNVTAGIPFHSVQTVAESFKIPALAVTVLQLVPAFFAMSLMFVVTFAPGFNSAMVHVALWPERFAPGAAMMKHSSGATSLMRTLFNVVSPGL